MPIAPTDRQTIAARAATIYERAAHVTPAAAAAAILQPTPAALAAIRSWNQAFAPGDEPAFLHRLSWDGLDRATVLAALGAEASAKAAFGTEASAKADAAEPGPVPVDPVPWLDWLDRISDAACEAAASSADSSAADRMAAIPFAEIWRAFQRVARAALDRPSVPATITAEATEALDHQLAVELARQGELAVFELFRRTTPAAGAGPAPDQPNDVRYREFVDGLLAQGLVPLFLEYPALARQLASVTAAWVCNTRELLERVDDDRAELASRFGGDLGGVVSIEAGVSDPHHGRRRVAILQFASGQRLVYKPRSLQLDLAFSRVVEWMNRDLAAPLSVLRVLDRGSHGWVECAAHDAMADRTQVASYFEQSGALMCLVSLLGAHDLHMENVVATSAGPVLVDIEMLLQPVRRDAGSPDDTGDPVDQTPETSVLDTGLLSMMDVSAEGEAVDAGGLRGQSSGPLPFPARVWHGLGTDALHYVEEPSYAAAGRHEVRLAGARQDPGQYADALLAGFTRAYRSLLSRRSELLASDGPLHAFVGSVVRVVQRPTNQYAMLRVVLSTPRYQRNGVAASTAVDVLHRGWSGAVARPTGWEIAIAERRALDRLDVPLFSVRADGLDLQCEGRTIGPRFFAQSGLAAAITRAEGLSERDLQAQAARLARALSESVASRYAGAAPEALRLGSGQADAPETRVVAIARWIGHAVLACADTPNGRGSQDQLLDSASRRLKARAALRVPAGWSAHRLYDGTLGPALLFAALAAMLDDDTWRAQAVAALAPLERAIRDTPPDTDNIGGADGLGSIVYGLTVAASLLGDRRWLELAQAAAGEIGPRIGGAASLDVVDGVAGAALALIALSEASRDAGVFELVTACGDRLLAGISSEEVHRWPVSGGVALVGFAHGVAGVTSVLARLAQMTGDPRYRRQAVRGAEFIAGQFLPASANYPVSGASGASRRAMLAWCHGAPGIVLGLSAALDICSETAMLSQVDAALLTTARDEPAQVEHLCCGAMGRVDAVLTVGRALGRADMVDRAWQLAEVVVDRAVARGHFRLSGPGVDYRVFDPGFFRGLSGIGYVLLRLAAPDRLPSIAGFEPPRNLT